MWAKMSAESGAGAELTDFGLGAGEFRRAGAERYEGLGRVGGESCCQTRIAAQAADVRRREWAASLFACSRAISSLPNTCRLRPRMPSEM